MRFIIIILMAPLVLTLAMPTSNVTVITNITKPSSTERSAPPMKAFINNRWASTQLMPTTTKRRILSLQGLTMSPETWPPPPPPPLEARPPTTAPTGPPTIIGSTDDPNDIDTKIKKKQQTRELKARKRRKKIKKLAKILKKNKEMLKKLLAAKHEKDKGKAVLRTRGKGREKTRGKERGKAKERGRAKAKGKERARAKGKKKLKGKDPVWSGTHRLRASSSDSSIDVSSASTEIDNKQRGPPGVVNDADKYDTMHARGGKIANMRLKGRVCQRSILNAEGPKYNRAGGEYKAMFSDKKNYFSNTKSPSLLLPRCCNCCKKSVLGCE